MCKYTHQIPRRGGGLTLRFVLLAFTSFPLAAAFFGAEVFGVAVKNPSSLPCCFALRDFASFSAPLRTRSSLVPCQPRPRRESDNG